MLKIKSIDSAHVVATETSILFCLWRTVTTRAAVAELSRIAHELVEQSPRGISMLTVVEADADMPDSTIRDELAKLFKALAKSVICSGLVFEGQGFKAATVRGITTGINLVARQPFPHKVFGNVPEAASWMATHAGMKTTGDIIAKQTEEVRLALDRACGVRA